MKILMLNYEYPPLGGGGGVIHRQIAEELARRHAVTVVTSGYESLPAEEVVGGVRVVRVPVIGRRSLPTASLVSMLSYYPASLRAGEALVRAERPDIINSHFAVPTGPSAVRLARHHGLPHVLSIHGGDIFDPTKRLSPHRYAPLRAAVRRVLRGVDRVVAPSRNTADNARRYYGFTGEIPIIPHGMKYPEVVRRSRAELGLPVNAPLLITVGRLVARKANDQLIRVFAALHARNAHLVLVGDGPERAALEVLAREQHVRDRVHFAGFVSEERKHELLFAADLFVSTTVHEGFGLMYLEAMARGLPVITYDHGGQSDFLESGRTGYLLPLGDRDGFRARVDELLAQPELRAAMAEFNRARAEAHSVEACARAYEDVYDEVIGIAGAVRA